jgi:hypothetical protein
MQFYNLAKYQKIYGLKSKRTIKKLTSRHSKEVGVEVNWKI